MSSLVLELQSDACTSDVRVSDLLRKALVVSKKLSVSDIEAWIQHELGGYPPGSTVPDYREVHGVVKARNPYHGWIPINFQDAKFAEALSSRFISQSVREIDSLVENKTESSFLQINFPQDIVNTLMRMMEVPLQPALHISHTQAEKILDAVRNNVLQWALELEQRGVLGEGMTFSKEERMAASKVTYQITNNIGSMNNSQLQQHSPNAVQSQTSGLDVAKLSELLVLLRQHASELDLSPCQRNELKSELSTLEAPANAPKPPKDIGREALASARTIFEGFAGNMLASQALERLNDFLSTVA